MLEETHDRRGYKDNTGGRQRGGGEGGRQVMWGRVMWIILDGPIIEP